MWTCTFAEYLGGASLLELFGVLLSSLPPFVPMIVGAGGGLYSYLSVVLCPTASVIPSSVVCCHPSDRRAQSFTGEMCVLLIAASVGGYFTWTSFLFVCFLSS